MGFNDEDSEGELSQMIEEHGGIVVYPYNEDYKENKIIIRSRDLTKFDTSEDGFDKLFIHDSITEINIVILMNIGFQCQRDTIKLSTTLTTYF